MRCLLFSYHFRNEGIPSAHHLMDRLPYLANEGIRFRLVNGFAARKAHDLPQVRVPPLFPGEVRYLIRYKLHQTGVKGPLRGLLWQMAFMFLWPLFLLERLIPIRDFTLSWCVPASLAGTFLAWRQRPDVIFSFGGRPNAHLAAGWVAGMFSIPWVAQVQDPLVLEGFARNRFEYRLQKALERLVMGNASRVVFMTETARRTAEERTGMEYKGVTNYAGFDPSLFPPSTYVRGDKMVILHAGTLGGSRTPKTFLRALESAVHDTPEMRGLVRVHLAGSLGGGARDDVSRFPYPDMLSVLGSLPRREVYRRMREADVLLLLQNLDPYSPEVINAKFYEYLFAGRPILGLLHRNDELGGLLLKWGHKATELEDVDRIKIFLQDLFEQWQGDALPVPVQEDLPTAQTSASRLAAVLRSAVQGKETDADLAS